MPASTSTIAAKDGAGATIAGGLIAQDKSGAGTGPFAAAHVIVDAQGVNVAAVTASNAVKVDGSAVTQPVSLTSTTITGTVAATQSGTWTVQPGNTANTTPWLTKIHDGTTAALVKAASSGVAAASDPALVVTLRDVNANVQSGAPVTIIAQTPTATANGATASRINAAASTNATNLKASAGQLYTLDFFNVAAYNVFFKLYNKASAPTVGTDTPIATIPVQAGGGFSKTWPMGLTFSTGISYAITKLQADSDTTVVVAGDLTGNTTWI